MRTGGNREGRPQAGQAADGLCCELTHSLRGRECPARRRMRAERQVVTCARVPRCRARITPPGVAMAKAGRGGGESGLKCGNVGACVLVWCSCGVRMRSPERQFVGGAAGGAVTGRCGWLIAFLRFKAVFLPGVGS